MSVAYDVQGGNFAPPPRADGGEFLRSIAIVAALFGPFVVVGSAVVWLQTAAAGFSLPDPFGDYVIGAMWAGAGFVGLGISPLPAKHKHALLLLWVVHVAVALGLMLAYESYYGLDAASYYNIGIRAEDPFALLNIGNGTQLVTGLVGLIGPFVGASYTALKVVWAFAGLTAVYTFYLAARLYLRREDLRLLYLLGLFPSVAFWGSILGKDPITLLGLAIFSFGAVGVLTGGATPRYIFCCVAGLLVTSAIRVWLGAIFLAPLMIASITSSRGGALRKLLLLMIVVPGLVVAAQAFGGQFSIASADDLVARTDAISQSWAYGGSNQQIEAGFQSLGAMVAFLPIGMPTALLRPLPGEILSPFGLLASIENALLVVLLLGALRQHPIRQLRDPVVLWMTLTVLVWAAVYGFVSYQNLGSAVRFKLQVLPLFVLLLLRLRVGGLKP